jgi:peptide/nickel transport system substrate-binding protein
MPFGATKDGRFLMREEVAAMTGVTRRQRALRRRGRRLLRVVGAMAGMSLVIAACGSGNTAALGTRPVSGGTVTWAMTPAEWPDYIFPFTDAEHFSVTNQEYFQELMYRTLYWFGTGNQPIINAQESLADTPTYHGQQVTIRMKPGFKWSDGSTVDAQDVVFWMNMMKVEKDNWGGYVPGAFPDNVTNVRAVGSSKVTMTIVGKYSPDWFTDNELSQITPLPKAWDRTSSGPSNCAGVIADCANVYKYLIAQNSDTSTYATSLLWSIVDGPWKLKSFAVDGNVTFTINPDYSGVLPRRHISTFEEEPFTTEQEEYDVLQAGGSHHLDVGYLPTVDAPVPTTGSVVNQDQNPLPGYQLAEQDVWGLNYMPYDFANPTVGPIFAQLYVRQAIQYLVDQEGVINGPLHGYGKAAVVPVPDNPTTKYLSSQAKLGDKYELNPSAAGKLLTGHGWSVVPNGQTTCTSPGTGPTECGAHITKGEPLKFSIDYVSGVSWVQSAERELASNAAEVGITIISHEGTFNQVTGQLGPPCAGSTHTNPACTWDMLDWGQGWVFSPDYLPTGEELFETGSGDNFGGYSNAENDSLIKATLHASQAAFYPDFYKWENYLAGQLPVVLDPETPFQLNETVDNLHAPTEPPTLTLTPEDWYYVK